ncbi:MAG: SHOCT domain-containing protein [Candidatus Velamenicoccus archaeovorus]
MLAAWCGPGWGGGPWFLVFPLFWIGVLLLLGFAFRRRWGGPWRSGPTAEDVLAERYARGEIGADEYRQRLEVLRRREG